ncbi:MAG: RNA polymerase sigma factor SigJ [Myxococcota bacterium]
MTFEQHRPQLFRLAYGMLGSVASAEDVVQEAWIRYEQANDVRDEAPFLRTVVSRLALDELRSARVRRETYIGPWLPEPLQTEGGPEHHAGVSEALSMATLAVLSQLSAAERAAFLLREMFDLDYDEIGTVLDRKEPAVRQLVRRARAALAEQRPRFDPDPVAHAALLAAFAQATTSGDLDGLKALLADDVHVTSDGGGKAVAATRVVRGPDHVARFFIGTARKLDRHAHPEVRQLNGSLAVVLLHEGVVVSALMFATADGKVTAVHTVRNPDKLRHLT